MAKIKNIIVTIVAAFLIYGCNGDGDEYDDIPFTVYFQGIGNTALTGIAVDDAGFVYLGGWDKNPVEALVLKYAPDGTLLRARRLGGGMSLAITVDDDGYPIVVGETTDPGFPIRGDVFQEKYVGPVANGFVTKLEPDIDEIVFSTYLGGTRGGDHDGERIKGVDTDKKNNVYFAGSAQSNDCPVTRHIIGDDPPGPGNYHVSEWPTAHVAGWSKVICGKFDPDGKTEWVVCLGGGGADTMNGAIDVSDDGELYIAGRTKSSQFPITGGAFQDRLGSNGLSEFDCFVTRFNKDGDGLIYSTYLYGSGQDFAAGGAVMPDGSFVVTGYTKSENFPLKNPVQGKNAGGHDFFVTRVAPDGTTLISSTYLGGKNYDDGAAVSLDEHGRIYVLGTVGQGFRTTDGTGVNGNSGVGYARFTPDGGTLEYSTIIGVGAGATAGGMTIRDGWVYRCGSVGGNGWIMKTGI